jgi:beta-glucanase (GH16 family)
VEEWSGPTASRFYTRGGAPNAVQLNIADTAARDGKTLSLVLGANPKPTPSGGAEVGTNDRWSYGTFASRLRTADCSGQSNAGVVTGLFTYFNDETDKTGDGLADNSEIDFEWLCAEPQTIYLTMWTDYRDSDGAQKRVGRAINLATGTILYTCYYTAFGDCTETLKGAEATPSTIPALAGYDSSKAYYEYGFEWKADSVVWWMVHPTSGQKIILWDYRGPRSRITQLPAAFLTNVWHTTDWPPESKPNAVQAPTRAVTVNVDWTSYAAP